tara:strand:+ start:447 stop:1427 length:981 start_codon:yes stop_codon:yes gene_type:complete
MKRILFFLIGVNLLISSCDNMETVIDLDVPSHEPVLVLNGLLEVDSNVKVMVSYSTGAFSDHLPYCLSDANVLLFEDNGQPMPLFVDTNNIMNLYVDGEINNNVPVYYYTNNYQPSLSKSYRIEVSHPNFNNDISAETQMPNDIYMNDQDLEIDSISNPGRISIDFSFDDDPSSENYYRIKIFSSCGKELDDWYEEKEYDVGYQNMYILSNDPSFPPSGEGAIFSGYTFQGDEVVFSDNLFNGQTKFISLDIEAKYEFTEYFNCDQIILEFSIFNHDCYRYYNSLGDHSEKGELGIFGGEIIPVYSNVENGLGVLISTNTKKITIK